MRELFRKHGKIIMTVISIMLMFIFALPNMRQQTPETRLKQAVGSLNGTKVTVNDINAYRVELTLLRDMHLLEADANGQTWVDRLGGVDENQAAIYWFVLSTEAQRYVTVNVSEDEAYKVADEAVREDALNRGVKAEEVKDVDQILDDVKLNRKYLAQVVSRLSTIIRYVNFLGQFPEPISAMELSADKEFRRVQVDYVPVDAQRDWAKIPAEPFTAGQIDAQFAAYKNVPPTPILTGPADPPVFLGNDHDDLGDFALLGYPGSVEPALRVREKQTIAWDGAKVERIIRRGDIIGINSNGVVRAPGDALLVSGGGRSSFTDIFPGKDLHGNDVPALPAEISGHHFPFGYKYPDRVKVEYLKFPRAPLRGRLEPTAADVAAAFKEFTANPYKFREPPAATTPATSVSVAAPGATQPLATQPATRTAAEIRSDWDDARVKAPYINEQLDLRTSALLKKLVDGARNKADAPWKAPTPPERAGWVDYHKLADGIERDPAVNSGNISGMRRWVQGLGFGNYKPVVETTGINLLGAADLLNVPGIGHGVYTTTQGLLFDFPKLATNIEELVTPDKRQPLGRLGLQLGHEGPEVTDPDGNVYLFRVIAFEKSHVPASVDEVRAQVVTDLRKLAAYNARVKEIKDALAKTGDLDALARQYDSQVRSPKDFNRTEGLAPAVVQNIRDFVKTAFTLPDPAGAKTPSVAALENEPLLKVFPMKAIRYTPASGADFIYEFNQGFFDPAKDPAIVDFRQKYLLMDQVGKRVKFVPAPDSPFGKK